VPRRQQNAYLCVPEFDIVHERFAIDASLSPIPWRRPVSPTEDCMIWKVALSQLRRLG